MSMSSKLMGNADVAMAVVGGVERCSETSPSLQCLMLRYLLVMMDWESKIPFRRLALVLIVNNVLSMFS